MSLFCLFEGEFAKNGSKLDRDWGHWFWADGRLWSCREADCVLEEKFLDCASLHSEPVTFLLTTQIGDEGAPCFAVLPSAGLRCGCRAGLQPQQNALWVTVFNRDKKTRRVSASLSRRFHREYCRCFPLSPARSRPPALLPCFTLSSRAAARCAPRDLFNLSCSPLFSRRVAFSRIRSVV